MTFRKLTTLLTSSTSEPDCFGSLEATWMAKNATYSSWLMLQREPRSLIKTHLSITKIQSTCPAKERDRGWLSRRETIACTCLVVLMSTMKRLTICGRITSSVSAGLPSGRTAKFQTLAAVTTWIIIMEWFLCSVVSKRLLKRAMKLTSSMSKRIGGKRLAQVSSKP